MKIIYGKGDKGTSTLIGNCELPKDHPLFEIIGALDEANADLGLAMAAGRNRKHRGHFLELQDRLFRANADLATPLSREKTLAKRITKEDTETLEREIAEWAESLPELKRFVMPGGTPSAAFVYRACTVVRRAERALVRATLHQNTPQKVAQKDSPVNPVLLPYLNRFSKLLFVLFLAINHEAKKKSVHPWYGGSKKK